MRPSVPNLLLGDKIVKKTYSTPKVTSFGSAVAATLGNGGRLLEFINFRPGPPA